MLSIVGDTSAGELRGYKNGSLVWTDVSYTGWDNDNVDIYIASNRANSRFLNTDFYEAIVAPREKMDEVYDYLINKWDLLPNGID